MGVKFQGNLIPINQVYVGVVALGFGNFSDLIDEFDGGYKILKFKIAPQFSLINYLPLRIDLG